MLLCPLERLRSIVVCATVHVCMCPSVHPSDWQDISGTALVIFTKFFVHVAYVRGSVLQHFVNGCIAYRREGGDRSAPQGQSVICDCLVFSLHIMHDMNFRDWQGHQRMYFVTKLSYPRGVMVLSKKENSKSTLHYFSLSLL